MCLLPCLPSPDWLILHLLLVMQCEADVSVVLVAVAWLADTTPAACYAVGQFKELVESSETDQPLQETLKKVLNFTSNGWQKAREHAMRAVSTDNRMRAWCADDSLEDGLLFKCYLGRVDLEAPVGELSPCTPSHAYHHWHLTRQARYNCT